MIQYHLRKKYTFTFIKRRYIHCLSKEYGLKRFWYHVLGLLFLHHRRQVSGTKVKGKLMEVKYEGCLSQNTVFSLLWNKLCSLLIDSVTLFDPYERSTFAPVSPPAECTFETWWKKFQQYKKSGQKPRSCLHNRLKVCQMKFFIKFEKDMTSFNLMSILNG